MFKTDSKKYLMGAAILAQLGNLSDEDYVLNLYRLHSYYEGMLANHQIYMAIDNDDPKFNAIRNGLNEALKQAETMITDITKLEITKPNEIGPSLLEILKKNAKIKK